MYLSFQATVSSVIAPETYKYYIEVSVWLLVELLATGFYKERERKNWASFGNGFTQVLGIVVINLKERQGFNEI